MNLILSGVQPLYGKTKEFQNIHVVKNINTYFKNYSIITHTKYNFLAFFHHKDHHSSKNEGMEEKFRKQIKLIATKIIKQKKDYKLINASQNPYKV